MANERWPAIGKITRSQWWRMLLVVAVLAAVFSFGTLSRPSVTQAHTFLVNGGAQLYVYDCRVDLIAAHVKGYNQDGKWAEWDSSWAKEWPTRPKKDAFETWNWYWKQDPNNIISVTIWTKDNSFGTGLTIPSNNTQDPYPFDCYYIIGGHS